MGYLLGKYRRQIRADLARYFHTALADVARGRYTVTEIQDLVLSLLEIDGSLLRAAVQPAETSGWDLHAYLLADLFQALSSKPHPARPDPRRLQATTSPAREAALARALQRKRARERRIRDGLIQ